MEKKVFTEKMENISSTKKEDLKCLREQILTIL